MQNRLYYLDISTTDPRYNLALEQYVFDSLPRGHSFFLLWQNDRAVIVGKHQNTYAEVNAQYVREHGLYVVRRLSGGGAVYHDLGNLNFTFICDLVPSEAIDYKKFCVPIVDTLKEFGVQAEFTGRNDMTICGKKFSGNAQYIRRGRVMHHGTILFSSDLSAMAQALHVDAAKLRTKGIRSVSSRVTNISEHLASNVPLSTFRSALLTHILRTCPSAPYLLTGQDCSAVQALCQNRYATWEWNYGVSPECTIRKHRWVEGCGEVDAYLTIEHGLISGAKFYGDFFNLLDPGDLAARLIGVCPDREGISAAIQGLSISQYFIGLGREDFLELLTV